MGKIAIDLEGKELVDEAMAPLFILAREHGLHPADPIEGDNDKHIPAGMTFPSPQEALEFLISTQHYTDYQLGERVMLAVLPSFDGGTSMKARVSWLPLLTHPITEAWRLSRR